MTDQVEKPKIVEDMAEMAQFVYDFYQSKLQHWNKIKNKEKEELSKQRHKERLQQLDEEEKVLREKLTLTAEEIEASAQRRLAINELSSSESTSESENEEQTNQVEMKETTTKQETEHSSSSESEMDS